MTRLKCLFLYLLALTLPPLGWPADSKESGYQWVKDIRYRTSPDPASADARCRLDLYYPTHVSGFPTVVWFHGGGLTGGDRSVPPALQNQGIAVVAAGYRLSPQVKAPAYIEDAAAAVAWTFRNVAAYGGATDLIFVSGHSAGGYLTSMLGLDKRWLGALGVDANDIAGLIPFSGQCITHFTIRSERGISDKQPIIDDLAPLFHVRRDAPPLLLITGDREMELLGRYEENAYLWRMMKEAGHAATQLRELQGFDHGKMADPAHPLLLDFVRRRVDERRSGSESARPPTVAYWSQFRGPNGQGIASESRLPARFGPETNTIWSTAVPPGHSSPVVWSNLLFLTATEPDHQNRLTTLALDCRNGGIRWRRTVEAGGAGAFHSLNNAASSTPAVDEMRVYVYFGTYGLIAYDHAGKVSWQRELETPKSKYGMATSPILYGDTLILLQDGDNGVSRLLAVNRHTGQTVWEKPRPLFKAGWSTPMIFRHDQRQELVVLGSKRLTAYEPSTGEEIWWAGGFSDETVGIPVADGERLFASAAALGGRGDEQLDAAGTWKLTVQEFDRNHDNQIQREEMTTGFAFIQRPELPKDNPGYGLPIRGMDNLLKLFDHDLDGVISESEWMESMASFAEKSHPRLLAIRAGAIKDATKTHLAWQIQRGVPETASLLVVQGRLYLMRDGGLLTCLRSATGQELFRERIGAPGQYIASPIAAGDRLVVASVPGIVTVIEMADDLRVLARNDLREEIYATPAVSDHRLYVRTARHVYALGN